MRSRAEVTCSARPRQGSARPFQRSCRSAPARASIQNQQASSDDGGKDDQFSAERSICLSRISSKIAMKSTVTKSESACAARFLSSADRAMTSILMETATNRSPVSPAAAAPEIVANVAHFSNRALAPQRTTCARRPYGRRVRIRPARFAGS